MAGTTPQRQFHGSCVLVQHQLHRVGESFDLDECFAAAVEKNMLKPDDVEFISLCLAHDAAGNAEPGPEGYTFEQAVKRLQYLVGSRMNLGDCA
ncbi:MAG: hypothetical protein Q4E12_00280 [Coriobacteriia bacterium]|nr:hypothetical protein [Coriobacteriia bacterium]